MLTGVAIRADKVGRFISLNKRLCFDFAASALVIFLKFGQQLAIGFVYIYLGLKWCHLACHKKGKIIAVHPINQIRDMRQTRENIVIFEFCLELGSLSGEGAS